MLAPTSETTHGRNSRIARSRATINKADEVRGNANRVYLAALSRDVQFVLKGVAQVDFHELTLGRCTNLLQCRCYSPVSIYSRVGELSYIPAQLVEMLYGVPFNVRGI